MTPNVKVRRMRNLIFTLIAVSAVTPIFADSKKESGLLDGIGK